MNGNIIGIFHDVAGRCPEKLAIVQGDRALTYGDLRHDVLRIASYLRDRGVGPGSRVLLFVPMSIDLYMLLLAIFHLGATAIFIDAWADRKRLAAACRTARPTAFIGTGRAQLLRLISPEIRAIPLKLRANPAAWHATGAAPDPAAVDPDAPALVTFTTGSTGAPKGAKRSHRFLTAQHRALVESLRPAADDVDMPVLPIFALSNLAAGITTVLPPVDPRSVEKFDPEAVVREIRRRNVTTSSGSPAFYGRLAGHCLEHGMELRGLRRIFLGGAPVFPELATKLLEAFPATIVTIVYGSTEAEPISTLPAVELVRRQEPTGSGLPVGRPVPSVEAAILPITDGPIELHDGETVAALALPAGEAGEICVAGEHVLREYYGGEDQLRATKIRAGGRLWHRTGDAGYLDEAGELVLLGRVRQSFEHEGRRIFPFPVEAFLQQLDGIAIGTIFRAGEKLVVVVEPEPGVHVEPHILCEKLREAAIPFDSIRILDALPRDPRHHSKIDYERLKNDISV